MSPGSAHHGPQTWKGGREGRGPKCRIETLPHEASHPHSGRRSVSLCNVVPGGCSAFISQQASAFKYLLCVFPVSACVSLLCAHLVD